jgi:glycosyltransferase involved in cell wall biosynthesis
VSKVCIVIPCFNNAAQLPGTLADIHTAVTPLRDDGLRFEVLLVDDGSKDGTWQCIRDASGSTGVNVRGIRLASNVGAYRAVVVGLLEADADAVIVMAADGDDPPALLPRLVAEWRSGTRLVLAARSAAGGGLLNRIFSGLYYRMLRLLGVRNLPRHGSDFLLADRELLFFAKEAGFRPGNTLIQLCQHADVAVHVPYEKGKRAGGGWNLLKRADLFILSLLTATGLPWPLMLMLAVFPSALIYKLRPYDLPMLFTEVEAAAMLLFAALVLPVLRHLTALMAPPPTVADRC